MMSINSVNFGTVTKTGRFAVNPQFLCNFKGPKEPLSIRMNCKLKPSRTDIQRIPGNSSISFLCVKPEHKNRFCAINSIKITQQVFQTRNSSTGNVLVQLYEGRCHACGEDSDRCWLEYTGHKVCSSCVAQGKGVTPYPYGSVDKRCCVVNSCGGALKWYSEPNSVVHRKAIEIYERYKTS
jgi:hypothetical protein